jgi:cytidine deaminase
MNQLSQQQLDALLERAFEAREHAYAPYSKFQVGACLLASSGREYMGCNIENAAFTPTNCAERTALFQAVYEGERDFDAIAIACTGKQPAYPCGVCRQALSEFCSPEMPVYCAGDDHHAFLTTLGALLPNSFGPKDLT